MRWFREWSSQLIGEERERERSHFAYSDSPGWLHECNGWAVSHFNTHTHALAVVHTERTCHHFANMGAYCPQCPDEECIRSRAHTLWFPNISSVTDLGTKPKVSRFHSSRKNHKVVCFKMSFILKIKPILSSKFIEAQPLAFSLSLFSPRHSARLHPSCMSGRKCFHAQVTEYVFSATIWFYLLSVLSVSSRAKLDNVYVCAVAFNVSVFSFILNSNHQEEEDRTWGMRGVNYFLSPTSTRVLSKIAPFSWSCSSWGQGSCLWSLCHLLVHTEGEE